MTVKRAEPMSRHLEAVSRMYSLILAFVIPSGVPRLGSIGIGVAAPEDRESLYVLLVPSLEVSVLLAILKMRLLPLKRRSAEKAVFIVLTEDSVAAMETGLLPFERYVLLLREPRNHDDPLPRVEFRRSITSAQLLVGIGPRAFCIAM